jgi:CDGSH-type Zn-finger protein
MTPSVESMKKGTCGCGRSRSGDCDGSHALTTEQWAKIQEAIALDKFLKEGKDDIDDVHNVSDQGG